METAIIACNANATFASGSDCDFYLFRYEGRHYIFACGKDGELFDPCPCCVGPSDGVRIQNLVDRYRLAPVIWWSQFDGLVMDKGYRPGSFLHQKQRPEEAMRAFKEEFLSRR